jgi:APA family basic amino acid/polyamine antiporter
MQRCNDRSLHATMQRSGGQTATTWPGSKTQPARPWTGVFYRARQSLLSGKPKDRLLPPPGQGTTSGNMGIPSPEPAAPELQRHFGLLHATALNVSMIVGAGVFVTIPFMLDKLPGPYALLGWLACGLLILLDGMVWSELGATLPGSGGSYLYLLECYGRQRWGRLMAFLFVWQFLISGPLEVASALIASATFLAGASPELAAFDAAWTTKVPLVPGTDLAMTLGPVRVALFVLGVLLLMLLYRRITVLGKLTVTIGFGVLVVIAWIVVEGLLHADLETVFDFSGSSARWPDHFAGRLGDTMLLALYAYLGYYSICYLGDEVRDPGRTIPRSILLSAALVLVLFVALHVALLGVVPWETVPTEADQLERYSLPAEFMRRLHGGWAVALVTALLLWSCAGSFFAGLLGYSRIPYGAARYGHFFAVLGRVHPLHRIPHISLLLVGGLTLFWSFFDLQSVITALIVTRILEQFVGQVIGVMLLRRFQPDRPRPYKIWLYPLPCLLALAGWVYVYCSAGLLYIVLGLATLLAGMTVFLFWSWRAGRWPFAAA